VIALTQAQPARTLIIVAAVTLMAGTYGLGAVWGIFAEPYRPRWNRACFVLFWVFLTATFALLLSAGVSQVWG
jgi:hypothetical protein